MKRVVCALVFVIWLAGSVSFADEAADVQALLQQGNDQLKSGAYEKAIQTFRKANKKAHDQCAACWIGISSAEYYNGDMNGAIEDARKAQKVATDPVQQYRAYRNEGNALLILARRDKKRLPEAEHAFRQAIGISDADAFSHFDLGIVLLREQQKDAGIAELKRYLEMQKGHDYRHAAMKLIEHPEKADYVMAPDFSILTTEGKELTPDSLQGKIVVLDFWATWCPPCVESVPELKELNDKYSPRGLVLISVSADEDGDKWASFVSKHAMIWSQFWDRDGRVARQFGVNAFPTYMILDGDGFVVERVEGYDSWQSVAYRLRDKLKAMPELK